MYYVKFLFEKIILSWVGVLQDNSKDIAIFDPQTSERENYLQVYESNRKKKS